MRRCALLVVVTLVLSGTAQALVLCTTPDWKTYAGDQPPAGCVERKTGPGSFVGQSKSQDDPANVDPKSTEAAQLRAVNVCKKGVAQKLQAPASAGFVEPFKISHVGGWDFNVAGDVDLASQRVTL